MPQFESTFFLAQVFWLLVCFGILWAVVQFWVSPRLTLLQKKRKSSLEKKIEEATHYQKRAELLMQKNQEYLEHAKQEAAFLIQEAVNASQNSVQEVMQELKEKHHRQMATFKKELDQKYGQVLSQLTHEIPSLVNLCLRVKQDSPSENRPIV